MKAFLLFILAFPILLFSQDIFEPLDLYDLEFVANPNISPDGNSVLFTRHFSDVMTDRRLSNLWISNLNGTMQRPLTTGKQNDSSPTWSPDGSIIYYTSNSSGKSQIYKMWLRSRQTMPLTDLQSSPRSIVLSPDGKMIAFTMSVKAKPQSMSVLPPKPEGAKWADAPIYIDKLTYRFDGGGYIKESYTHIFTLPVEGGTPRQVTSGNYNHNEPNWSADGSTIYFSANRDEDWEYTRNDSELFKIDLKTKEIQQLTDRFGPDRSPQISPDGKMLAYLGYDDKKMGYHHTHLYIKQVGDSTSNCISQDLDLSIGNIKWNENSNGLYFQYDKEGNSKVGHVSITGKMKSLANDLGGTSIGRPYSGGDYDQGSGKIIYTKSLPDMPAELVVISNKVEKQITHFNADVLAYKNLGVTKEVWASSSFDSTKIQGWLVTPPNFDPDNKYPLLLEIHGGPFTNYGNRFSPEIQLLASKGYAVLYTNPRGSTSYGADFANLIHHDYPGNDYHDLMSIVDHVIANESFIDGERLFVTGGSGGGVLTSWIIGNTDRFKAAVVAKPVINWYSWALTADISGVVDSWFPGMPWDHEEHFMKRSPISLVGNVTTPTMLLTGEQDYRTPMSESEQYYQALKLRKIPSALVRIQGAGHGIANRPSNLLAKVGYITTWFDKYDVEEVKKP